MKPNSRPLHAVAIESDSVERARQWRDSDEYAPAPSTTTSSSLRVCEFPNLR